MFFARNLLLILALEVFGKLFVSVHAQGDIEQALGGIDIEELLAKLKVEGPTVCPSDSSVTGYSNITQLVIDLVFGQLFNPMPKTFTVCPNTVYNITTELVFDKDHLPIVVPFDDLTINCGVDGSVKNGCIFNGGYVHAVLGGKNTVLNGFTFKNSVGVSVVAAGPSPFTATLNDCIWQGNKGYGIFFNQMLFQSVLEIAMDTDALLALMPTSTDISGLPRAKGDGMDVTFENCQFVENEVEIALMYNNQSSVVVNNGVFERNSAKAADIILQNGSKGTITNTCFSEESDQALGLIYVSADSTYNVDGTHSSDAKGPSACSDIFIESSSSDCLIDSIACSGIQNCETFTATSCADTPVSASVNELSTENEDASDSAATTPEAVQTVSAPASTSSVSTSWSHSATALISFYTLALGWLIL